MNRYNRYRLAGTQTLCERQQNAGMAMPVQSEMCPGMLLAVPFVQWQYWGEIYDPDTALRRGTIFPELDLPFCGSGVKQG